MREERMRSGSRHRTTSPSLVSSIASHWLASTYSRFRFFSSSVGLMRSALNASYGTPKNFDSAAPIAGILTWNSSVSTCSTSIAFLRACRERSEEHTSELQSSVHLVCRLLLEKKKKKKFFCFIYKKKKKKTKNRKKK